MEDLLRDSSPEIDNDEEAVVRRERRAKSPPICGRQRSKSREPHKFQASRPQTPLSYDASSIAVTPAPSIYSFQQQPEHIDVISENVNIQKTSVPIILSPDISSSLSYDRDENHGKNDLDKNSDSDSSTSCFAVIRKSRSRSKSKERKLQKDKLKMKAQQRENGENEVNGVENSHGDTTTCRTPQPLPKSSFKNQESPNVDRSRKPNTPLKSPVCSDEADGYEPIEGEFKGKMVRDPSKASGNRDSSKGSGYEPVGWGNESPFALRITQSRDQSGSRIYEDLDEPGLDTKPRSNEGNSASAIKNESLSVTLDGEGMTIPERVIMENKESEKKQVSSNAQEKTKEDKIHPIPVDEIAPKKPLNDENLLRREKERLEKEQIYKEEKEIKKMEKERKEQEERERKEKKIKEEQEIKEKKQREKLEKEQADLEVKENKRLAKEQKEKDRMEKEQTEKEEKELKKLEKERKEQEERERREKRLKEEEELKEKRNREKLEKEQADLEAKENKRLAKEQKEKDERMKKEQKKAQEIEEKERKMNEKLEKERRERDDKDKKRKEKEKRVMEQNILKQKKEAEELEIKERKSQERKDNEKRALSEKETKNLSKDITARVEKSKEGHVEPENSQNITKSENDEHHCEDKDGQKVGILNFDSQDAPLMIEKERIYDKECSSRKDEVELPLEESAVKTMSSPDSEALMQPAKTKRHQRDETKQASHPPEGDESDFVSAKDSSFTLRPHLSQQTMDDTLSITSLPTDTQQQLIDDHAKEVSTEDKTINHKSIDNINDSECKSQTFAQSLDVFNESNKLMPCAQPDDDAQNEILAEGADNTVIKKDANITYESKNVCRDDDRPKIDKKKEQNEVKKRMKEEAKKKKMEEKEKAKLRNDERYQKQKDLKERWNALEMEEAKRAEMILEEKTKIRIEVKETNRKMKEDEKIKKLAEKEAKRMMSENLARQQHEYKAKWYNQDKEALLEKEGKEKDANKRKQDDKDMKKLIQTEKERKNKEETDRLEAKDTEIMIHQKELKSRWEEYDEDKKFYKQAKVHDQITKNKDALEKKKILKDDKKRKAVEEKEALQATIDRNKQNQNILKSKWVEQETNKNFDATQKSKSVENEQSLNLETNQNIIGNTEKDNTLDPDVVVKEYSDVLDDTATVANTSDHEDKVILETDTPILDQDIGSIESKTDSPENRDPVDLNLLLEILMKNDDQNISSFGNYDYDDETAVEVVSEEYISDHKEEDPEELKLLIKICNEKHSFQLDKTAINDTEDNIEHVFSVQKEEEAKEEPIQEVHEIQVNETDDDLELAREHQKDTSQIGSAMDEKNKNEDKEKLKKQLKYEKELERERKMEAKMLKLEKEKETKLANKEKQKALKAKWTIQEQENEEKSRNQTKITKEPIVIESENERMNPERNDYPGTIFSANDEAGACISSDVPVSIVQKDENEQAKQDRDKSEELILDGNGLETLNEFNSGYDVLNQGPVTGVTTPEEQKSKVDDKKLQKEKEKQDKLLRLEENRKQKEMKAQMKLQKEKSKTEMKRKNDEMQKILKKRWLNQEEMKAAKNSEGTRTDTEHIDSPETLARPESILKTEDSAIEIENTENINPFLMEFAESVSSDIIKEAKAQNTQEEDIDEEIEHQTEQETIIINAANNSSKVEGI